MKTGSFVRLRCSCVSAVVPRPCGEVSADTRTAYDQWAFYIPFLSYVSYCNLYYVIFTSFTALLTSHNMCIMFLGGDGMNQEKESLVRVGSRISTDLNEWLDERSAKTGLSKSSIIMLALEQYRKEHIAIESASNLQNMMELMREMSKKDVEHD